MYCEFLRADKLQFNLTYKNVVYPDTALKLRVFCYMKNGGYAFGDEFENIEIATFDSTRTAKYSGYGTITIQLVDADENLINSANVVCKIIESNSTTPFVASPDFAQESKREIQAIVDNGKNEIALATKEAKEEIDSWSDQEQRLANTESNIASLQMFKANTGALHFNGASSIKLNSNQNVKEFCWCYRFKVSADNWSTLSAKNEYIVANKFSASSTGFGLRPSPDGSLTFQYCGSNGNKTIFTINASTMANYTNDTWHFVVLCGFNNEARIYFDGKLIASGSVVLENITPTQNFQILSKGASIQYADVFHFNFDVTSADALYTIADYQQGKPIPPKALNGTLLALENYTIANGTSGSKIIFDYSGNGNDATITGDVKGDNDNRIAKLVNFILER